MSKKLFGKSSGRSHFPELATQNQYDFNGSRWFVEVDTAVKLEDLLDPATWGPQKLVRRGDLLHAMHAANEFFALLVCIRVAAGFPTFEILMAKQRETSATSAPAAANGEPRLEYRPGSGFTVIKDGKIVASCDTREEAAAVLEAGEAA